MQQGRDDAWGTTIRPALIGFAIFTDAFVVAALGIARPDGWFPPFAVFTMLLCAFVALGAWAVRHRHDEDR